MLREHSYSFRSIRLRSEMHRSYASRCELIRISSSIKHRLHDFVITTAACKVQWCIASDSCRRLHCGTCIKQELGHLEVIIKSRPVQGRETI